MGPGEVGIHAKTCGDRGRERPVENGGRGGEEKASGDLRAGKQSMGGLGRWGRHGPGPVLGL